MPENSTFLNGSNGAEKSRKVIRVAVNQFDPVVYKLLI